jgi:hypothetical protein
MYRRNTWVHSVPYEEVARANSDNIRKYISHSHATYVKYIKCQLPRHDPKSDSSVLRINGVDLTGVISRAKIIEKRHLMDMNMKRNQENWY